MPLSIPHPHTGSLNQSQSQKTNQLAPKAHARFFGPHGVKEVNIGHGAKTGQ